MLSGSGKQALTDANGQTVSSVFGEVGASNQPVLDANGNQMLVDVNGNPTGTDVTGAQALGGCSLGSTSSPAVTGAATASAAAIDSTSGLGFSIDPTVITAIFTMFLQLIMDLVSSNSNGGNG